MYSGLYAKKKFVRYVWLCLFTRVGRVIELLVIKSLSEVGSVVCCWWRSQILFWIGWYLSGSLEKKERKKERKKKGGYC